MDGPHFVYSLIGQWIFGLLPLFFFLAVVNNAAVDTGVQISLKDPVFGSLEYVIRSGIAESYGNAAPLYISTSSRQGFKFLHIHCFFFFFF